MVVGFKSTIPGPINYLEQRSELITIKMENSKLNGLIYFMSLGRFWTLLKFMMFLCQNKNLPLSNIKTITISGEI